MPIEGEVERKLNKLVEEIWTKLKETKDGEELIRKEKFKAYISETMAETGNGEHYDDEQFEECFKQIDFDGTGEIEF